MPDSDNEWINTLILNELRELRTEFHKFKEDVISERAERKGRQNVIAGVISLAVSVIVAIFHGSK